MLHLRTVTALGCGLALVSCQGADDPSVAEVRSALARATDYLTSISTEGGYLWRYSADLQERWGEERATPTQVWVQPPGTPAVGTAFLRAYQATGDERHLRAALAAASALVRGQLESGGWAYVIEFDSAHRRQWAYHTDASGGTNDPGARKNLTTFDDNTTQSALRFLLACVAAVGDQDPPEVRRVRSALDHGLDRMIQAQYPNGAWPQRWDGRAHDPARHPVRKARIPSDWPHTWPRTSYSAYYTLNDGAQLDCIETMLEAFHQLDRRACLEAAKRGGEFLILAQLPEPQPGWAQQYNFDMEPAWARAFEPPAICSSESAVAARTLVDLFLETGEQKYLDPIPPFIAWIERSKVGPERWARLYELGSNQPIYGDRDGAIHYQLAEVSAERQRGYSWQGSYGIADAIEHYENVLRLGRDAMRESRRSPGSSSAPSPSRVARVLEQQDDRGRWLRNGEVDMEIFIANIRLLAGYLAGSQPASP